MTGLDFTNPSHRQEPEERGINLPNHLNNRSFRDAWWAWNCHLSELCPRLSTLWERMAINRCAKFSCDQVIEAIEFAISNNWRTLKPESSNRRGKMSDALAEAMTDRILESQHEQRRNHPHQ